MYRRILVPVDGSPTAARGLREAIRLAKSQRARLRLVHVVDETMVVGAGEAGVDLAPLFASFRKAGRALLERTQRAAKKLGVDAETAIYESVARGAADAILRDAKKWRADLIVMGTHGRRGVRRLVLGSDAEQVVRLSPVPVLLVRGR
jgi:nucleotide-binding universal stress UspA family protein